MDRLLDTPIFHKAQYCNINGRSFKNHCCAIYEDKFIFLDELKSLFLEFHCGEEDFKTFIEGRFAYVLPNADITPFQYDPFTGEKIDWLTIRKIFLK